MGGKQGVIRRFRIWRAERRLLRASEKFGTAQLAQVDGEAAARFEFEMERERLKWAVSMAMTQWTEARRALAELVKS